VEQTAPIGAIVLIERFLSITVWPYSVKRPIGVNMARGKTTTKAFVDARINVEDLIWHIAKQGGQYVSPLKLGKILYELEAQIQDAAKAAMMEAVKNRVHLAANLPVNEEELTTEDYVSVIP
jgi:hypothetical protein